MKMPATTKELLIYNAGELFAEYGYEAVSTRMIAEQAGVKLSAIHYHFGSKENLYQQVCLFAHDRHKVTTFNQVIQENPLLMETPEGQAEIIRTVIFRSFFEHFLTNRPEWVTKILLKEIVQPTSAMELLVKEVFRPDAESSLQFYKAIKPEATDAEAAAWSDMHYGQLILYKIARKTIEMTRPELSFDETFYRSAAATLAKAMILEAGLPLSTDLQTTRNQPNSSQP